MKREFKEELETNIQVENFLGLVENFFEYNTEKYHEVLILFECKFNKDNSLYNKEKIACLDSNSKVEFVWEDITKINELDIRPKLLKEKVINGNEIGYIVND